MRRQNQKDVGGTKTRYIYSMKRMIAEYDGSGSIQKKFVYGTELDEVLIELDSSNTPTFLHHDRMGSVVATSNSSGVVVNTYAYSPFGEGGSMSGTTFGYTGQRYDPETGLYYYKNRHYSPELGRFLQPDPVGYLDGLNVYQYALNDPNMFTDPEGLVREYKLEVTGLKTIIGKLQNLWAQKQGTSTRFEWGATLWLEKTTRGGWALKAYDKGIPLLGQYIPGTHNYWPGNGPGIIQYFRTNPDMTIQYTTDILIANNNPELVKRGSNGFDARDIDASNRTGTDQWRIHADGTIYYYRREIGEVLSLSPEEQADILYDRKKLPAEWEAKAIDTSQGYIEVGDKIIYVSHIEPDWFPQGLKEGTPTGKT